MTVRFRTQLIPSTRHQRPGYRMLPTTITVHNTANPDATAANHADYVTKNELSVSYHLVVDDIEAVLLVPLNEQAWHTGTHVGNTTSIGVEVCEFTDEIRHARAEANAVALIAGMLAGKNPRGFNAALIPVKGVVTHQSWMQYGTSGKYCPRKILPHWNEFIEKVRARYAALTTKTVTRATIMRAGPAVTYRIVHRLAAGEKVTVLSTGLVWAKVRHDGVTGWMLKAYLR